MQHRETTRLAYADRIARVVAHIARNLEGPLDLERLAGVACFSPYHFHRLYRTTMGETPDQTVRRLRLNRAAGSLRRGDLALAVIARRAGYGSVEAFSRAFSNAYGCAPSRFRAARAPDLQPPGRPEIDSMYDVIIKDFEGLRLTGLPHLGDYNDIGGVFERLLAWAAARRLIDEGTRSIGIYYDDPDTVPVAERRSFAGLNVEPGHGVPEGVTTVELAPGPMAVLLHKGPYADLEQAYRHLYAVWLPASGREPADRPPFEEYLNDYRVLPPSEWLTAVCLPLVP